PAIGGQEVDVLAVLRHRVVRPPRPLVERIGEVDRAVRPYPHVVRAVQTLPAVLAGKHADRTVRSNGPELVPLVGTRNQMARGIETHAVGATRGLKEGGESPIHAPFQDAIVGLVGEEHVAVCVTRRSLGEFKTTGQFRQRGTGGEHTGTGSARTVFHNDYRVAMKMKSRILFNL